MNTEKHVGLVNAEGLLKALFPDPASRPSVRWVRLQQAARVFRYVKIGGLVFFDAAAVRADLDKNHTIAARQS